MPRGTSPLLPKATLRRRGLRGLDPALFERPKRGFVLPYDRWIGQGLSRTLRPTLRRFRRRCVPPGCSRRRWPGSGGVPRRSPGLYWSRVWAVYVLVRWCQRHGVRA